MQAPHGGRSGRSPGRAPWTQARSSAADSSRSPGQTLDLPGSGPSRALNAARSRRAARPRARWLPARRPSPRPAEPAPQPPPAWRSSRPGRRNVVRAGGGAGRGGAAGGAGSREGRGRARGGAAGGEARGGRESQASCGSVGGKHHAHPTPCSSSGACRSTCLPPQHISRVNTQSPACWADSSSQRQKWAHHRRGTGPPFGGPL